jgi:pimeloyl-ACP methyl ester carboxylesterase
MLFLSILASITLTAGALDPFMVPAACLVSQNSSLSDLQAAYKEAYATESANWLANVSSDPFYQSPANISAYTPGDSVRIEQVSSEGLKQYPKLPQGLSLFRMLYQSVDLEHKRVPASAFILLPYARSRPHAPLNVIVWTHGTAGIERQCAPSNRRDLYYDFDGPFTMALRGYAVIGPDYAGLGTDTTFNYLASPSHAADVTLAVVAARRAFSPGLLAYEWVVVGHSEGGLTAWAVNEREVTQPIGGFLGAVALAPALQNMHIISDGVAQDKLGRSLFYSSYTLTTIARLDKSVDVTKYFSDLGMERTRLAATGCFMTAMAVFTNLTFSDIFKDQTWLNSSWAMAWESRTAVSGVKPLSQPLLLVEGLGDRSVFPAIPENVFARHCNIYRDARVHLSRYPRADHDPLAFVSQFEYFNWIEDRFNGVDVAPGCTNATVDTISPESIHHHSFVVQT